MTKQPTQKEILRFIRTLRGSFPDSSLVYRYGGCYGFYQVMKHVFPTAIALFDDKDENHIIVELGPHYYDIGGIHIPEKDEKVRKLKAKDHEYWIDMASGQRLEYMIAKWQKRVNQISKQDS